MSGPGPYSVRPFKRHAKAVPEWPVYDSSTGIHEHITTFMSEQVANRWVANANRHADELAAAERADANREPFG